MKPHLSNDEYRLYEMIWHRFAQSQMSPARYANTSLKIQLGRGLFEAKGRQLLFEGFLALAKISATTKMPMPIATKRTIVCLR